MAHKSDYIEKLEEARTRFENLLGKIPFEIEAIQREIDYLKRRETEKTLTDLPLLAWDVIRKQLDTSEETLFYLCMASPVIHQIISMKRGKSSHAKIRCTGDKVIGILTQNLYLDKVDLENLSKTKKELANFAASSFPFLSKSKCATVRVRDTAPQTGKRMLIRRANTEYYLEFLKTAVGSEALDFFATTLIIDPQGLNRDDNEDQFLYWDNINCIINQCGKHLTYIELTISETKIAYQLIQTLARENFSILPRVQRLAITAIGVKYEVVADIDKRTRSKSFRLITNSQCPQQNRLLPVLLPEATRWLIRTSTSSVGDNHDNSLTTQKTTTPWKLKEISLINQTDCGYRNLINTFQAAEILEKIVTLRVFNSDCLTTVQFCTAFASLRELRIDFTGGNWKIPKSETVALQDLKLPSVQKLTFYIRCDEYLSPDVIIDMFQNLQILVFKNIRTRDVFKMELPHQILLDRVDVFRLYKHGQSLETSNAWEMFSKMRVLSLKTIYESDIVYCSDKRYIRLLNETYSRLPSGNVKFLETIERYEAVRTYDETPRGGLQV